MKKIPARFFATDSGEEPVRSWLKTLSLDDRKVIGKDMNKERRGRIGSSFDAFLAEEGMLEECEARAIKEVLAMQVNHALETEGISKAEMARRMNTSRPALDRLLDGTNTSITLHTLQRAAAAVGKRLRLELVDAK